jgi:poly-gamma-glutamate capsule biosynthesis protein CapA/YwtB (metallophosphatase superfamily)
VYTESDMKISSYKPHHSRRLFLIIIPFILLVVVGGYIYYNSLHSSHKSNGLVAQSGVSVKPTTTTQPSTATVVPDKIHISAMGDMLAHDTIDINAKTTTGYDFAKYFTNIRPAYKDSDVVFCNQEGLSSGETFGISGYPSFNAPTVFSAGLQSGAGCNVINLANNHMGDKGVAATNATLDNWASLKPLAVSGANKSAADQTKDIAYTTIKGIKLAFVSFADFNNNKATPSYSVNIYHDQALFKQLVSEARAHADFVMVSMHWGTEDSHSVNPDQIAQVKLLASMNVDVVIGTGPHVLQKVETVDRSDGAMMTVWYSIGNMLSSQLKTDELVSGIAGFDVIKTAAGKVSVNNLSFIPTYMHYEWTAAEQANYDLAARKNAMLYLLKDAAGPLSKSLLATTVTAQQQAIASYLGPTVTINN